MAQDFIGCIGSDSIIFVSLAIIIFAYIPLLVAS